MKISVLFTDLDGTLLEPDGRLGPRTAATVARLRALGVPIVPMTSKTESELRAWLQVLGAGGVGVFENGAGFVTPRASRFFRPRFRSPSSGRFSRRWPCAAARARPLDDLPAERLAAMTGLAGDAADRARARVWDLPSSRRPARRTCSRRRSGIPGVQLVRGGAFWHLSGRHDKADAVPRVRELFARPGSTVGSATRRTTPGFSPRWTFRSSCPGRGAARRSRRGPARARLAPAQGGGGWAAAVDALLETPRREGSAGLEGAVAERLKRIGKADVLVGIPSFNNERTVGHVVRAVARAWPSTSRTSTRSSSTATAARPTGRARSWSGRARIARGDPRPMPRRRPPPAS